MQHLFNNDFENSIKSKLDAIDKSPSPLVWYGIEANLPRSISLWNISVKAILVASTFLLLGGISIWLSSSAGINGFVNNSEQGNLAQGSQSIVSLANALPKHSLNELSNIEEIDWEATRQMRQVFSQTYSSDEKGLEQISLNDQIPEKPIDNTDWEAIRGTSAINSDTHMSSLEGKEDDDLLWANINNLHSAPNELKWRKVDSEITGFHVGPIVGLNNSWLINKDLDNLRSRERFGYNLKFGFSYGFSAGFDFTPKSGIQIDWIVQSNEGQSFEVFNETGSFRRNVHLNFLRVPVLYKYRMSRLTPINAAPMVINYIFGIQYGRLNWVNIDPDLDFIKAKDFNEHEWGVVLGLEYDFYVGKNYFVTLGGRGSINTNLNSFPLLIDSENDRPVNCFIGITSRINFAFDLENR